MSQPVVYIAGVFPGLGHGPGPTPGYRAPRACELWPGAAPLESLVGARYGCLRVREAAPSLGHGRRWACDCDFVVDRVATTEELTTGRVKSCGCLRRKTG
jgi:hypothetical protein